MSARAYTAALVSAFALVVALQCFGLLALQPHDDAWFFKRFALNFLAGDGMAWNAEDGPVYGNTSQLYQLVAIALTWMAEDYYIFGVRLVLSAALVGAAAVMIRLAGRYGTHGHAAPVLLLCSPVVLFTIPSGMETALAIFAIASFLLLLRSERALTGAGRLMVPGGMVVVYLLRPDAVVLVGLAWAWDRLVIRRVFPWQEAGAFVLLLAVVLLAMNAYYGTALPLSFYLKSGSLSVYSESFIEISREGKVRNIALFFTTVLPILYVALQRPDRRNIGLLLAGGAFVAYHYASTVEVMGMYARFYAPAIPVLAAAALPAFGAFCSRRRLPVHVVFFVAYTLFVVFLVRRDALPDDTLWIIERLPPELYVGYGLGAWLLLVSAIGWTRIGSLSIIAASAVSVWVAHPERSFRAPSDADYMEAQLEHRSGFREIDRLPRCLGEEISIYHSEIGLPGVKLPQGHITDLAGLMTREFAFGDKSFDEYCLEDEPEAIYLPHRNYDWLNQEIRESQCLRGFTEVRSDTSSPLYIRDDLLARYRRCP